MTDQQDTHERYRGGGREAHDRWNRADRYGPRTTHRDDRTTTGRYEAGETTGQPVDPGQPADPDQSADPGYRKEPQQPSQRYGSQRGQSPQSTPGFDRGSPGERPSAGTGERPPAGPGESPQSSRERRPERTGPDRAKIPAGSRQSPEGRPTDETPQTGRKRRSERGSGPGRQPSGRGRPQERSTGRTTGQGWQEAMREDLAGHRRSTVEHGRETRDSESEADTSADESAEGDDGLEQPRDPETGRFLSKDEAKREEE